MAKSEVVPHPEWSNNRDEFSKNYSLGKFGSKEYWTDYMEKSELNAFKESAYNAPGGYSIRTNPYTGHKELFIRGTVSMSDWIQNVADGSHLIGQEKVSAVSHDFTQQWVDELEQVIADNGIEVVYGHSRGAAVMSAIKSPNVIKIGIDGATAIGEKGDYLNISQSLSPSGLFDNLIGMGHSNTIRLKSRGFHDVTRSKKKEKRVAADTKKKLQSKFTLGQKRQKTRKGTKKLIGRVAADFVPEKEKLVYQSGKKVFNFTKSHLGKRKRSQTDTKTPLYKSSVRKSKSSGVTRISKRSKKSRKSTRFLKSFKRTSKGGK